MSDDSAKSEVSNFDHSLVVDEHVLRLEVTVKHFFIVHILNTLQELPHHFLKYPSTYFHSHLIELPHSPKSF